MNILVSRMRAFAVLPAALLCFIAGKPKSNECEQVYRFLFKEKERNAFWIAENLYGECSRSHLIQVDLDDPLQPVARKTVMKEFNRWTALEQQLKEAIACDPPLEILPRNGVLHIKPLNARLYTPERNEFLEKDYKQNFALECARRWNDATRQSGINLPPVSEGNISLRLLYASPDGLYFNYHIDKAYYFVESSLLLIFTKNNSFKCRGEVSSMHGFMILQVIT